MAFLNTLGLLGSNIHSKYKKGNELKEKTSSAKLVQFPIVV